MLNISGIKVINNESINSNKDTLSPNSQKFIKISLIFINNCKMKTKKIK